MSSFTICLAPGVPQSPPPLLHVLTDVPPSPTSVPVPPKRLRSCLSPGRRRPSPGPFGFALSSSSVTSGDEPSLTCSSSPSPMTSRSTSFSSQDGAADYYWRRGRSVRWDESDGCIQAAYYSTWSAEDYDRSPLEPPKPEERACLMPARGSRCLSPLDCFADINPDNDFFPCPPIQAIVPEPLPIPAADDVDPSPGTPAEEAEDKEWEECMERRRMMFAQMCRPPAVAADEPNKAKDDERRFEGYTSISASLVAMLASSGIKGAAQARDASTPVGTPVEVDEAFGAFGGARPRLVRVEHRLRVASFADGEVVDEEGDVEEEEEEAEEHGDEDGDEDEEEEEEAGSQPSAEAVFEALRLMRMGQGRDLRTGAEERDRDE